MRHLGCSAFRFPRCGRGAKPGNGVRTHMRPARTRSEAEKQRQRWESSSPTRIVPSTELFQRPIPGSGLRRQTLPMCYAAPEEAPWYGHMSHLKNLYMAFNHNDNYRKWLFIWNADTIISSESSRFTFLQLSASDHLFWVLRRFDFPASRKEGSGTFLALTEEHP